MNKALIGGIVLISTLGLLLWYMSSTPPGAGPLPKAPEQASGGPVRLNDTGEYHDIEASYPSSTRLKATAGAQAEEEAVNAMKLFVTKEIAAFKERSGLMALTQEDIDIMGLGGERKFTLDIAYIGYLSSGTVSYVFNIYEDTMGAHPNAYYRTFTFDASTGEGLIITDLFESNADYLTVLSEKARTSLQASLGENTSMDMLLAGTTPDLDNFQNFYLEGDALVIIFAPYQVGPWAIGTQEVRIPKSELTGMLKAQYQ